MKKLLVILSIILLPSIASAGIYERITASDEGDDKIAVHTFSTALRELSRGAVTKQQVVNEFSLDSAAEAELDAIIDKYLALATDLEKADFLVKIHDVFVLVEAGFYNKSKAKTELGF